MRYVRKFAVGDEAFSHRKSESAELLRDYETFFDGDAPVVGEGFVLDESGGKLLYLVRNFGKNGKLDETARISGSALQRGI